MLTTETCIDKSWIEAHIPHQSSMCLLDHVKSWDEKTIICCAISHQLITNPLRHQEQLNTACGIEYAAQAMAVHGALLAPAEQERPQAGFLVSVRGTTIYRARLDDLKQALTITATLIHSSEENILYAFTLHADHHLLLEGRATVILNTASLLGTTR